MRSTCPYSLYAEIGLERRFRSGRGSHADTCRNPLFTSKPWKSVRLCPTVARIVDERWALVANLCPVVWCLEFAGFGDDFGEAIREPVEAAAGIAVG